MRPRSALHISIEPSLLHAHRTGHPSDAFPCEEVFWASTRQSIVTSTYPSAAYVHQKNRFRNTRNCFRFRLCKTLFFYFLRQHNQYFPRSWFHKLFGCTYPVTAMRHKRTKLDQIRVTGRETFRRRLRSNGTGTQTSVSHFAAQLNLYCVFVPTRVCFLRGRLTLSGDRLKEAIILALCQYK